MGAVRPHGRFDAAKSPPAPDYASHASWAALPGVVLRDDRTQPEELVPDGEAATPLDERPADCFFVHPTGYFGAEWNAPLDDPRSIENIGLFLANQASAFNRACRIFAPKYRQATIGAFLFDQQSGRLALELAYSDVAAAFRFFLEQHNGSRPFVLACHSQGGWHLQRLLEEEVEGQACASRLVAAYLIGGACPRDKFERGCFPSLHECDGPCDTQCVIGWETRTRRLGMSKDFMPGSWYSTGWESPRVNKKLLGTNPYSWRSSADDSLQPGSLNKGILKMLVQSEGCDPKAVRQTKSGDSVSVDWKAYMCNKKPLGLVVHGLRRVPVAEVFGTEFELTARVDVAADHDLIVPLTPSNEDGNNRGYFDGKAERVSDNSYHWYDYQLFYFNIRENVPERVQAFLNKFGGGSAIAPADIVLTE